MKKFKKSLACACATLIALPNTCIYAENIKGLTSMPSVVSEFQQDKLTAREDFIRKINEPVTFKLIHNAELTYREWVKTDLAYVSSKASQNKFTEKGLLDEVNLLQVELQKLINSEMVELRGAKVEPYYISGMKDAIISAIEVRENIIDRVNTKGSKQLDAIYPATDLHIGSNIFTVFDKTMGENPMEGKNRTGVKTELLSMFYGGSDSKSLSTVDNEDLGIIAGILYDVLLNEKLPNNLVKGLKMYISPYRFQGYTGFTTSFNFVGREEEVFIGVGLEKPTYYSILNTILHELGHVYQADMIGMYSGAKDFKNEHVQNFGKWSEYSEMLACKELEELESSEERHSYVAESIAEHFRIAMYPKLGFDIKLSGEKAYPYVEKVGKSILKDIEGYDKVKTFNPMPTLAINGNTVISTAYNSKKYETYSAGSDGLIAFAFGVPTVNNLITYKYDIYKRVGDSAETVVSDKTITNGLIDKLKLEKGEYAIVLHTKDSLYRFIDFYIR